MQPMGHKEAVRAVAVTLGITLAALAFCWLIFLAGWGLVALYVAIVPASWLAPLTVGLAVVAGLALLAGLLYLAFREIPGSIILIAPMVFMWAVARHYLPNTAHAFDEPSESPHSPT